MLARLARFSCAFTTACRAFCRCSGRTTSTLCAATSNASATLPTQNSTRYRISAKTDQILQLSPKITVNADVAGEHNLIANLESHRCLLLTSSGINCSQIQIQPIE